MKSHSVHSASESSYETPDIEDTYSEARQILPIYWPLNSLNSHFAWGNWDWLIPGFETAKKGSKFKIEHG